MAELVFWYAGMNTGKSAKLLQYAHSYHRQGKHVLLFTTELEARFGQKGEIVSRTGLKKDAYCYTKEFDFFALVAEKNAENPVNAVFVDEAQFLLKDQVKQLAAVVDTLGITVHCYGLRTDFQGNLFEGARYLLAWADCMNNIPGVCFCGDSCSMHLRVIDGQVVQDGPQILISDGVHYTVCRKHFMERKFAQEVQEVDKAS